MSAPGASGAHKGLTQPQLQAAGWEHLPWLVVVLATSGDATLLELSTVITTAGAYDLLDLSKIRQSWEAARILNQMEANA